MKHKGQKNDFIIDFCIALLKSRLIKSIIISELIDHEECLLNNAPLTFNQKDNLDILAKSNIEHDNKVEAFISTVNMKNVFQDHPELLQACQAFAR